MLTLDIVDFIENLNSQLMQLTRFKILKFKRLFPLICFARFWSQRGEISLFVSCFSFAQTNNLQLVSNILGTEHILVLESFCI